VEQAPERPGAVGRKTRRAKGRCLLKATVRAGFQPRRVILPVRRPEPPPTPRLHLGRGEPHPRSGSKPARYATELPHSGRAEFFAHAPRRPFALSLLNHSGLSAPILGPRGFVVSRVCRHFHTKTYGLNSRAGHAERD